MPDQTFDEVRDPNMLYDDSDQTEFHECLARIVEGVHWNLERYLFIQSVAADFHKNDKRRARKARGQTPALAAPVIGQDGT